MEAVQGKDRKQTNPSAEKRRWLVAGVIALVLIGAAFGGGWLLGHQALKQAEAAWAVERDRLQATQPPAAAPPASSTPASSAASPAKS